MIDGNKSLLVKTVMGTIKFLEQEDSKILSFPFSSKPSTVCEMFSDLGCFLLIRLFSSFLFFILVVGVFGYLQMAYDIFAIFYLNSPILFTDLHSSMVKDIFGFIGYVISTPMVIGAFLFPISIILIGSSVVSFCFNAISSLFRRNKGRMYDDNGYPIKKPDGRIVSLFKRFGNVVSMLYDSWKNKYCIPIKWED